VRDDRVGHIDGVHEVPDDPVRRERLGVGREPRHPLREPLGLEGLDLLDDRAGAPARTTAEAILHLGDERLEREARVADQG